MYRVTCLCRKTENYSNRLVANWIYRKCKKCNSNLIVYDNDIIVCNYNYKKDRVNSKHKVNAGTVINLSTVELTELVPNIYNNMNYEFKLEKDFYVQSHLVLDEINDTENIKI